MCVLQMYKGNSMCKHYMDLLAEDVSTYVYLYHIRLKNLCTVPLSVSGNMFVCLFVYYLH